MFCPQCGKEIPDESRFCLTCGVALSARSMSVAQTAATEQRRVRVPATVSPLVWVIIGIVSFFAVVFLIAARTTAKITTIVRPQLNHSKMYAYETAAVKRIQIIHTAQTQY